MTKFINRDEMFRGLETSQSRSARKARKEFTIS